MEDIFNVIIPLQPNIDQNHRTLRKFAAITSVSNSGSHIPASSWKTALWDRQSIEPAMLRVPIVIITFLFLWTVNLWFLERNKMQYLPTLTLKSAPIAFSFLSSIVLFTLYAVNMSVISNFMELPVETAVSIYYGAFLLLALLPGYCFSTGAETRNSFFRLLKLCIFPGSSISFAEVLFADALTSLSKVMKDFGVTLVAIYAQFMNVEIVTLHDTGMILVALFASFPFWVRVRQCWVQYDGCSDPTGRTSIMLNIIKYLSAFPPIWIAAAASLGYFHPNLPTITAIMATINSLYSFTWDFVMDWGLVQFPKGKRISFRSRFLWPIPTYFFVVILNLVLRFTWASNRLPFFSQLHASHLVLIVEILEVFRRALWNFYRIEWEVLTQQERAAASSRI